MSGMPPPPGKLFDVGGYKLHIQMHGNGSPTAVMDSGLGGNSIVWANVLLAIAEYTQACAFDRAGYTWSEPAPPDMRRTSLQIVAELRTLLMRAEVQPPYILLGHSFGAINMLVYAYQHPQEVAGLVLVDPSHPEMFERVPGVPSPETMVRMFKMISGLGRIGLLRWLGPMLARQTYPDGQETLPSEAWQAIIYFSRGAKDFQTVAREASAGRGNFAQARGAAGSLGDLPLEVLTADWWTTGKQTPMKRAAVELREEMARLSLRGRHLIVSGCDHGNMPLVRQDAVAQSVRHVLAGLAMAAYLLLYGWLSGLGLLNMLALFAPNMESGALVGVLAHLAVSGIYGAVFGVGYAMLLRRRDYSPPTWVHAVIGAAYGLLLLAAAWLVLFPATGSQMQEIPLTHLAIGHVIYGAVLGLLVYRGVRRTGDNV